MTNTITENDSNEAELENKDSVVKGSLSHILNFRCPITPLVPKEYTDTYSGYPILSSLLSWLNLYDANKERELILQEQRESIKNCLRLETSKHEKLNLIKEYPVLGDGAIVQLNSTQISQVDAMLSRTYSENKQLAATKIHEMFNQNTTNIEMLRDLLSVIVLGIAKGESYPFTKSDVEIDFDIDIQKEIQSKCGNQFICSYEKAEPFRMIFESFVTDSYKVGSCYYSGDNNLVKAKSLSGVFHGLTHAAMQVIFDFYSNPYYSTRLALYTEDFIMLGGDEDITSNGSYYYAVTGFLKNLIAIVADDELDEEYYEKRELYEKFRSLPAMKLVSVLNDAKKIDNPYIYSDIQANYFADQLDYKITTDDVFATYKKITKEMNISRGENECIFRLANLFDHTFEYKNFDRALLAKVADLTYRFGDDETVQKLFAPIYGFWHKEVHPIIMNDYVMPHQQECSGEVDMHNFAHCVAEYLA